MGTKTVRLGVNKHQQENILVGSVLPACQLYVLVATTRCQYQWGMGIPWDLGYQPPHPGHTHPLLVTPGGHHWRHTHPPEQTYACENITFPQLLLGVVNIGIG